jgi:hypothetical protein
LIGPVEIFLSQNGWFDWVMIKKLTQKLHGLPGIPQIKANDGADGT